MLWHIHKSAVCQSESQVEANSAVILRVQGLRDGAEGMLLQVEPPDEADRS